MEQSQKVASIKKINALLNQLNDSLDDTDSAGHVKNAIKKAYFQINSVDDLDKKYKSVPEAVSNLKVSLEILALHKLYNFTPEQNEIIHQLDNFSQKSFLQELSSLINAPAFFH